MTMEKVYDASPASPYIQRLKMESFIKGFREGWLIGWHEGKYEFLVQVIIRRLTMRFGRIHSSLATRLAGVAVEAKLLELVDVSFECDSHEQFLSALPTIHQDPPL